MIELFGQFGDHDSVFTIIDYHRVFEESPILQGLSECKKDDIIMLPRIADAVPEYQDAGAYDSIQQMTERFMRRDDHRNDQNVDDYDSDQDMDDDVEVHVAVTNDEPTFMFWAALFKSVALANFLGMSKWIRDVCQGITSHPNIKDDYRSPSVCPPMTERDAIAYLELIERDSSMLALLLPLHTLIKPDILHQIASSVLVRRSFMKIVDATTAHLQTTQYHKREIYFIDAVKIITYFDGEDIIKMMMTLVKVRDAPHHADESFDRWITDSVVDGFKPALATCPFTGNRLVSDEDFAALNNKVMTKVLIVLLNEARWAAARPLITTIRLYYTRDFEADTELLKALLAGAKNRLKDVPMDVLVHFSRTRLFAMCLKNLDRFEANHELLLNDDVYQRRMDLEEIECFQQHANRNPNPLEGPVFQDVMIECCQHDVRSSTANDVVYAMFTSPHMKWHPRLATSVPNINVEHYGCVDFYMQLAEKCRISEVGIMDKLSKSINASGSKSRRICELSEKLLLVYSTRVIDRFASDVTAPHSDYEKNVLHNLAFTLCRHACQFQNKNFIKLAAKAVDIEQRTTVEELWSITLCE